MIDDGGPAFPCDPDKHWFYTGEPNIGAMGMSLRDWFAGQALAGWLATFNDDQVPTSVKSVAKYMYEIADAMLAEQKKSECE